MTFGGLQKLTLIDYPGKVAATIFTVGCNFLCPYCHNPELVDETVDIIPTEDVLTFLRTRIKQLDGVTITGGEPTMHDDLIPFIKEIKALGFKVKLDSNGTNPEMLEKIINEHLVDYLAMDIKAPFSDYASGVGRPVDIEKIKKSVRLIMSNTIPYEFRTTVVKALLSPEDIINISKDIKGAKKYYLQKFVSTKILNPGFIKKTTYTDEEFKEIQKNAQKYVTECYIR
ncbi:anaerobic ribonucleoside-triphosphate reductase activating protein [Candidatus Kaiserbacteria bacterium]|nr:anaerobic ribonucleoside-triphosphate reductase activating protein [Candidatus Kaiserbacteria bacterium]